MTGDALKNKDIEEEAFLILHSGEIPEIAYHGSIYYLVQDQDGPCYTLTRQDLAPLREAVIMRYRKIILRDLKPANRDRRIYRGLARSIVNWKRLCAFADREGMDTEKIREEVAEALIHFLRVEERDVSLSRRHPCINCSARDLISFCRVLGISSRDLPEGIEGICRKE